jgi:DnaK suppressor protein
MFYTDGRGQTAQNELNRFRAVLTVRVVEPERVTRHRDGITVERGADQLEEIQAASHRALAVCNLDREFNQLREARAALRRAEEGNFGTCQACDEDIHPKRLAAIFSVAQPNATRNKEKE